MSATQGTPIAWPLRAWLGVEVLFGVGAVMAIGVSPEQSGSNFAWGIKPVVMAAVLGAFYMTSAPLFILPLLARRWENIRVMILPTALFCTVQLIATFLHWDKFLVGTTPFYVWFASYLLPPGIFVAAYLWHQRRAGDTAALLSIAPAQSDDPLPTWLYWLFIAAGVGLMLFGLVVFIFPGALIPFFPWQLTPLTARSLCGWLILLGSMLFGMARENNRTRARLATPMLFLLLPALLLQMSRFTDEVQWVSPALWVSLALFLVIGLSGVYLAIGSWRAALR